MLLFCLPFLWLEEIAMPPQELPVTATPFDLIYGLDDVPPVQATVVAALQHVMACFISIVTTSLVIGEALNLPPATIAYLVSMSLFVSGISTLIQVQRVGPVGSGLLSVQGTSFTFMGPVVAAAGAAIAAGATPEQALGSIFGLCFVGSFIEIFLSRFLQLLARVITPLVTGTVVCLIGLTLMKVGITAMGGGIVAVELALLAVRPA